MGRRQEFFRSAEEAAWACRLSIARIETPTHPPGIDRYQPLGGKNLPWKYDYYFYVLSAKRLLESSEAINESLNDPDLTAAIGVFSDRWQALHGLRNVLQHPQSTQIKWECVYAFRDRIEYRPISNGDPHWRYTLDELRDPVESLWSAVKAVLSVTEPIDWSESP